MGIYIKDMEMPLECCECRSGNFRDAYETALVKALIDCSPTIIPTEEKPLDCPSCGGKGTVVGFRTGVNEHFHGTCAACGARIME